MDKTNFISFVDYKNKFIIKPIDNKSVEEVLREAELIATKISHKRGE